MVTKGDKIRTISFSHHQMPQESGDGAVVKALASHPCGLGSIPGHGFLIFHFVWECIQTCPGVRKTVPLVVCFSKREDIFKSRLESYHL